MSNKIDTAVGINIRAARIEQKLTQQALATRTELSRQTISNLEKGMGAATQTVDHIANCLGVSPFSLYREPDRTEDVSFKRVASTPVRANKSYAQEIQRILDVVSDDTRNSFYNQHIQPALTDFFSANTDNLIIQVKRAPQGREQAIVETFRDDLLGSLRASVYDSHSGQDSEDELIEE